MSQKQQIKELFEKLKAHSEKNNDPELDKIIQEYQAALETGEEEEEDNGGNNPEPPDIP